MNAISKIYNKIILLVILILFLYVGIFSISSVYDVNRNIEFYNYKSLKHSEKLDNLKICEIFDCSAIKYKNNIVHYDKNLPIVSGTSKSVNVHIIDKFYFDTTIMAFSYKIDDKYVYFNISRDFQKIKTIILSTLPLIVMIFMYVIILTIKEEKEELLIATAGNEALLANRSMINITENIHHELNTPLEVIDNKIEKIRRVIQDFKLEQSFNTSTFVTHQDRRKSDVNIPGLEEDFEFIKNSSEQIYAVLEKMKGFKHLRYSNGNKSIKNIIDGGFKIINISNTNFEYKVDKKLTKFRLNSEVLKNADLLNIMLNHIKNSLEANASKIFILVVSADTKQTKFRIIDNGNGIPRKAQREIFKANFSTKSTEDGVRGNGMYLNKYILNAAGGDIKLINTSSKGTTFELTVPSKVKEK